MRKICTKEGCSRIACGSLDICFYHQLKEGVSEAREYDRKVRAYNQALVSEEIPVWVKSWLQEFK